VLSNLESHNAEMIKLNEPKTERFKKLLAIAQYQIAILNETDFIKSLKKNNDDMYLNTEKK